MGISCENDILCLWELVVKIMNMLRKIDLHVQSIQRGIEDNKTVQNRWNIDKSMIYLIFHLSFQGKGSMQTYWLVGREGGIDWIKPASDTYTEFERTADEPTK